MDTEALAGVVSKAPFSSSKELDRLGLVRWFKLPDNSRVSDIESDSLLVSQDHVSLEGASDGAGSRVEDPVGSLNFGVEGNNSQNALVGVQFLGGVKHLVGWHLISNHELLSILDWELAVT